MAKNTNSKARKRLVMEDAEIDQETNQFKKSRVDKGKKFEKNLFKPNYERPNTCLKNGIQVPKRALSPDILPVNQKNGNKNKNRQSLPANTSIAVEMDKWVIEFKDGSDKSNNNASGPLLTNPDPDKFVLTRWGDVQILGKRKIVTDEQIDAAQAEADALLLDDGIQVTVNDHDEFDLDFEDNLTNPENEAETSGEVQVDSDGAEISNKKQRAKSRTKFHSENDTVVHDDAQPGTSQMTAEDLKLLEENPRVHSIINKMLDRRFKQVMTEQNITPKKKGNNVVQRNKNSIVRKSPSDTTIYAPTIQKQKNVIDPTATNEVLVSDFLGMVRAQVQHDSVNRRTAKDVGRTLEGNVMACDVDERQNQRMLLNEEARKKADNGIINAEKFSAEIAIPPSGNPNPMISVNERDLSQQISNIGLNMDVMNSQRLLSPINIENAHQIQTVNNGKTFDNLIPNVGAGVSDDDFFHLTCHIDPNLIHKIEKGEFIELEKLLPKDRIGSGKGNDENRLEWVQRDGNTFLVSAGRDTKITGIRRWEQAFRAYATIYCAANPHRSKKIWQYIAVINTAASSFAWDNVYNYDITFRHLMAFNPSRSWAVCYNQMWNLSMRDSLPKNQYNRSHPQVPHLPNKPSTSNSYNQRNFGKQNGNKSKPDHCWNFNKGVPCKFGKRCKYIERCSYCDDPNHGVYACPKLESKRNSSGNHNNQNNGNPNK